jgi:hypothetical protein
MADLPSAPIIRQLTCDEHRCKLFADLRFMERVESGELLLDRPSTAQKTKPFEDDYGRWCIVNEQNRILDPRFAPKDPRYEAVKTHRHITDTGEIGASGKYDPKTITTPDGIKYQPLPYANSTCELCESGDMIHPRNRFRHSKYRPSVFRYWWVRIRARIMP